MQAEPRAQRALLDIAAIDTQITQVQFKKRSLPEHEQLQALNQQRQRLSEALVAVHTRISDAELEQERVESDLEPAKERLVRNQRRVDDGVITDTKSLRAMLDEIEHLKGRIHNLEDAELEVMQNVEDEIGKRDRLTAERAAIETQMRALIASRDSVGVELDGQLSDLHAERARLVAEVPSDVMALYERIAQRSGTGAALLSQRRCQGCSLEVDSASMVRFAAASPDAVLRCEECGRILVRTKESGLG